jgi:hypothetical protein
LYALLVVYLWLWMNDITLYLDLRFMWLYKLPIMLVLYEMCVMTTLIYMFC